MRVSMCQNSSLEKKPENGGIPDIAIVPISMVAKGYFDLTFQATHFAHVLLATHSVDHRACAQEQ